MGSFFFQYRGFRQGNMNYSEPLPCVSVSSFPYAIMGLHDKTSQNT